MYALKGKYKKKKNKYLVRCIHIDRLASSFVFIYISSIREQTVYAMSASVPSDSLVFTFLRGYISKGRQIPRVLGYMIFGRVLRKKGI